MRSVIAVSLIAAIAAMFAASHSGSVAAQDKKDEKKSQPKFDPPKIQKPDEATLKQITEKTEQLRKAIEGLKAKKPIIAFDDFPDVEIYLKAAENIVRFDEWFTANSGKWALTTLDQGLERAKQLEGGKPVWRDAPGKWVVRAYRSQVDGSVQPYAVLLPHDYGKDPKKKWRLDVVLHGRDSSLTEAKFIATHSGNAPKDRDFIQLEVYGRGNNAYRWAGETDVTEAIRNFAGLYYRVNATGPVDKNRIVLRGFSMGGAGTWHLGLRRPSEFCVIGPGAGFTTTHGYIANLPKELPEYQEKCLRIYDAIGYTENAFNIPIIAYSGEKDAQKKAADNIEEALKSFKEPHQFTHLVAPGLEHQMPKEWQDKAEIEYRKFAEAGRDTNRERVRFVTYTGGDCDWLMVDALDTLYEKAIVDATRKEGTFVVKTTNVRMLSLVPPRNFKGDIVVTVDDQKLELGKRADLEKVNGKWSDAGTIEAVDSRRTKLMKHRQLQGPIDDAFTWGFFVGKPTKSGWNAALDKHATSAVDQFGAVWDRYFRGKLALIDGKYDPFNLHYGHLILFGDPQSNPLIASVLPKLPITWTKEKLVVNGVEYDPKTHVPVLIYPNPLDQRHYVVINSGHTFKEADLKGTNALLYPRLGDWAVIKPTSTEKDPAAYEVIAAGLFDENWQFAKKK